MKKVSIVIPSYNEAGFIRVFLDTELAPVVKELNRRYEVQLIIVDDGSADKTLEQINHSTFFSQYKDKKVISFCRNFGKEIALTAGIKYADGDAVIMIDADGQHPADAMIQMLERWENGARIVTAVSKRNNTKHKIGSALFYRMMKVFGNKTMMPGAMDFRLLDREVVDEFCKFTEHRRITRGLIDWLGFPQDYIVVKVKGRTVGEGTYTFRKLMALASDSFVSMSRTPLLAFGYLGAFITVFSFAFGLFILIQQYILGDPLGLDWSGAVAMCVFVSFLVGIVLISQAITALYISQIHTEEKNRPLYVVDRRKSVGLDCPCEKKGLFEGGKRAK